MKNKPAAAVLDGLTSPRGAVIARFIVGVLENLSGADIVGTETRRPDGLRL